MWEIRLWAAMVAVLASLFQLGFCFLVAFTLGDGSALTRTAGGRTAARLLNGLLVVLLLIWPVALLMVLPRAGWIFAIALAGLGGLSILLSVGIGLSADAFDGFGCGIAIGATFIITAAALVLLTR